MDKSIEPLLFSHIKFHRIIKQAIFAGPQIRKLMKGGHSEKNLNAVEEAAWKSFKKDEIIRR